jgi:hypothetical protein
MYEPLKETTKEEYARIWTHFAVGHFTKEQLAKLFECSEDKIAYAIEWCANNRLQFRTPMLAEAAKEAVEARIRELRNDLVMVREKEPVNYNWVLGINKYIKENEELLWKLEGIIQDKTIITQSAIVSNVSYGQQKPKLIIDLMTPEDKDTFIALLEKYGKPPT